MADEARIIGIDLGTTNSVVSIVEGDEPVVIPNQEGSNKTPSVVAFLDNNECIVGEIARRQAATNPARTISSIKRLMGLTFEDVEEHVDRLPFAVVEYEGKLLIDVEGLGYGPEQISALILKKLKESAENFLGEEVTEAVITVPANFDDNQRNATIEAATLAGLKVLRLINEPTAAALAYGLGKSAESEEIIAVFDFGGGTFDITILEISGKTFEVLTSIGDSHLGGDDLDNALVDMIVEEFEDQHGVDLKRDPVTLRRLKEVAEKAKCELSAASQTTITLPFIAYRETHPLHLERTITREEFEELIEPFVNRTIKCCRRAIEDSQVSKNSIDKVILVGGSTRIPMVQDTVEDFFALQPFKGINPDEVVALGAATQAGVFSGNIEEVTLLDVAPHSLGIEVKDGKFSRIIEKNSTIPIKAAKNFTTTEDNQSFVNIHILQGESTDATENRSLGKFSLTDIPAQQRGRPRIRVTFFVNADGVMEISAEELSSGMSRSLTIVHTNLDENEKKVRKRARQKRKTRAATREKRPARYDQEAAGQPAALAERNADSSVARKRESSSAARAVRPSDENFAILGDTDPGAIPTRRQHPTPSSRDAVPLPRAASRTSTHEPEGIVDAEPPPEIPPPPPPKPPPATPPKSDASSYDAPKRYGARMPLPDDSAGAGVPLPPDQTPASDLETDVLPSNNADTKVDAEPDWPGIVDSALDALAEGSETAESRELYQRAHEQLSKEPWATKRNFPVYRARIMLLAALGREDDMRTEILNAGEAFGPVRAREVDQLYEELLPRVSRPAALRRDRARVRESFGDFQGACDDMEAAAKLEPLENDTEVLERLYKARVDKDADPAAKFKLVKIYLKSNRVDEAIDILQELQNQQNYETRAIKILGLCHWQKNLHFLAWQKFKMLKQSDEIRDILYRLGNDMENTGQLNNALSVYEHVANEAPDYKDVDARIKKLRYRIKMQRDDAETSKGAVLSDSRFVIIEEINRGSMGIIYKARDKTLEEIVALKILNDYLCADPSAVERFKREARAAKKLSHPYIVRIHDMFESGDKRFISMEFIEGTDLKRLQSEGTRLVEEQLVFYFLQICDALSYAHKLGIVHRDIKPANVMITKEGHVKVTDFGIAKILKSDESTKSGTAIIGTPLYMAPEQITGESIDARTDIYSLGIMMYELTSGHPPFYLGNIEYHHIHTAPPPLPESVTAHLRNVIMKCMEKSPDNRFQSVDDIYDALNTQR